jgi:hypothetical protein
MTECGLQAVLPELDGAWLAFTEDIEPWLASPQRGECQEFKFSHGAVRSEMRLAWGVSDGSAVKPELAVYVALAPVLCTKHPMALYGLAAAIFRLADTEVRPGWLVYEARVLATNILPGFRIAFESCQ